MYLYKGILFLLFFISAFALKKVQIFLLAIGWQYLLLLIHFGLFYTLNILIKLLKRI